MKYIITRPKNISVEYWTFIFSKHEAERMVDYLGEDYKAVLLTKELHQYLNDMGIYLEGDIDENFRLRKLC